VTRLFAPVLLRGAMIGMLAAASMLGGCGRKGDLEPPPSSQPAQPVVNPKTGKPLQAISRGRPVAPKGENKPLLLDWLLD
jgi:predicted small lipoprotein YifL